MDFDNTTFSIKLRDSTISYSYPFFIVAGTQSGKFTVKIGQSLTLAGLKHSEMPDVKWDSVSPSENIATAGSDNFWSSENTFVLDVPIQFTAAGNFNIELSGALFDDKYLALLPIEVTP